MDLTRREIKLLTASRAGRYVVRITLSREGFYQLAIDVDGGPTYQASTTRGATKGWRHVADTLDFVRDNCTNFRDCVLAIEGWEFRSSSVSVVQDVVVAPVFLDTDLG